MRQSFCWLKKMLYEVDIKNQYKVKLWVFSLSISLMGLLSVFVDEGFSIAPILITLVSLSIVFEGYKGSVSKDDKILILALLIYFLIGVFESVVHGQHHRNLDLFSRYFFGAWLVFYLSRYSFNSAFLWLGYAAAGIVVGLYALYGKVYLGFDRVKTETLNPMYFGNFSMMIGVFCFAGIVWAKKQIKPPFFVALMIMAGCMGVMASFLSGTRGGWVGIPLIVIMFYMYFSDHISRRYLLSFIALVVFLLTALISLPNTGVMARIDTAVSDIKQYSLGNSATSVGLRFEMWRLGMYSFYENPIIGPGEEQFNAKRMAMAKERGINERAATFTHLHNQYVEELAKRGLLGFIGLLFLFLVPLRLFLKRVNSASGEVKALAVAGALCVTCVMEFCLTESMLRLTSGAMFFIFNLVFIWSVMRSQERLVSQNSEC